MRFAFWMHELGSMLEVDLSMNHWTGKQVAVAWSSKKDDREFTKTIARVLTVQMEGVVSD
jgi:hypothetical protein